MAYYNQQYKDVDLTSSEQVRKYLRDNETYLKEMDAAMCLQADIFLNRYFKEKPNFEKEYPHEYASLNEFIIDCRWVSLPAINQKEVLDLFTNNINSAWSLFARYDFYIEDTDFLDQKRLIEKNLMNFISGIFSFKDQDAFKNKLQDALRQSEQLITIEPIIDGQLRIKPTLAHWFDLYFEAVGVGAANQLKIAQFYAKDKNFQKLSDSEKAKMKMIFHIYNQMRFSSQDFIHAPIKEYMVNDEGVIGVWENGVFTPFPFVDNKPKKINKNQDDMYNGVPSYKPTNEPLSVTKDIFGDVDAKEIEDHSHSGLRKQAPVDKDAIIKSIKEQFHLTFSSSESETRFNNLTATFVLGIRDAMEYKAMLTRPADVGGLDYRIETAEAITDAIKKLLGDSLPQSASSVAMPQITPTVKSAPTPEPAPTRPSMPAMPALTPSLEPDKKPQLNLAQAQAMMDQAKQIAATMKKPEPVQVETEKKTEAPIAKPVLETSQAIPQVRRLETNKPIVQDIKKPIVKPVLMGPQEELGTLDLSKFRKLAENSVEAAEKIKHKIELLEEQSFVSKSQGILAFKNSPLNAIYLRIGNTSIDEGRSVQEVINSMTVAGEKVLTMEEFDAIADLNKKIRY
ncbi:MAG: hypothetical protein V1898_03605 [Patescibacteria group bacterium]